MLTQLLARDLQAALGAEVVRATPVGGGDSSDAHAVALRDGRTVFVKSRTQAPADLFAAEAHGLAWLKEASPLRLPRVLGVGATFLALEWLQPAPRASNFEVTLGRGLAAMHRFGATALGLSRSNYIGPLPQNNAPCTSWASFYRDRRLRPQLDMAQGAGLLDRSLRKGFDMLLVRLDELVGDPEPPARLHGDLWGGNLHVDDRGQPSLIDPAAYAGHREMDLAMMRLFGGFGARIFAAYDEAYPLAPSADERVPLYQLYPLLVHVNVFGRRYLPALQRALQSCHP